MRLHLVNLKPWLKPSKQFSNLLSKRSGFLFISVWYHHSPFRTPPESPNKHFQYWKPKTMISHGQKAEQYNSKYTDLITTEFLKDTTTRETGTHINSAIYSKTEQKIIQNKMCWTQDAGSRFQSVYHYQTQEKPLHGSFEVLLWKISLTDLSRALKLSGSIQQCLFQDFIIGFSNVSHHRS